MAMIATNVALCSYQNNYSTGEIISRDGWDANVSYYYVGCDPAYNHNRVLIVRFTLERFAKSVTIPLATANVNGTSATAPLCYGLGPDPEIDSSMVNASGDEKAAGTFYFTGANNTQTITLRNVSAGTRYLYVWGLRPSDKTLTQVYMKNSTSITYEELESLCYIDTGNGFAAYQAFIDNGSSWDLCIPYVDNGTSWDICS